MSFPIFKANHQFSDFMLFDLSFDTIDYLVLKTLISFGFRDTLHPGFPLYLCVTS